MRALADAERIRLFMRALGGGTGTRGPARVYFTGGASAVLAGWRPSTIDSAPSFRRSVEDFLAATL